jgi:hypothetical protein
VVCHAGAPHRGVHTTGSSTIKVHKHDLKIVTPLAALQLDGEPDVIEWAIGMGATHPSLGEDADASRSYWYYGSITVGHGADGEPAVLAYRVKRLVGAAALAGMRGAHLTP